MAFIRRATLLATIATVQGSATENDKLLLDHCGLNTAGDHYMADVNGTDYYTMDDANRVFCNIWLFNATGAKMLDQDSYPAIGGSRGSLTCDAAIKASNDQLKHDCGLGGKKPSGGGSGDSVVDEALKYFTKEKYDVLFSWIKDAEARVSHGCNCAGGKICELSDEWYTYQTFVDAFRKYPEVFKDNAGVDANEDQIKVILASFMALSEQETGSPGDHGSLMCRVIENNMLEPVTEEKYPMYAGRYGPGVRVNGVGTVMYIGRGPFQLSYAANYKDFTTYVNDGVDYAANPVLVSSDPFVALSTAFWFFGVRRKGPAFARGLPEYMMHPRSINGVKKDFGILIFMINGIECGVNGTPPYGVNVRQAMNRVKAYRYIYNQLTGDELTDTDDMLLCADLPPNSVGDNMILNAPLWTP